MTNEQRTIVRTIAASLLLLMLLSVPGFASDAKFRPAAGSTSIAARYRVALSDDVSGEEDEKIAASLIATYGGRIEPYAEQGFRGFLVTMSAARARMLSTDARVLWVEEQLPENQPAPLFIPAVQPTPVSSIATTAAKKKVGSDWVREGALWDSGAYTYDGAGNITAIGDLTSPSRDLYSYDQAGRLLTATAHTPGHDNQQTYTYDRYGNMTAVATAGAQPRLIPVIAATNQLTGGNYDDAGSQRSVPNTSIHYTWDGLSMLTTLAEGDPGTTPVRVEHYVYDAGDERIAVIIGATETYSLRGLDHKVMREFVYTTSDQTWRVESDYVYRGSVLLASFRGDGEGPGPHRHFHVDHLGTPRLITDAAGYKLALRTYWPFGSEAPGSEWLGEKLQFTGHERDYSGDPDRNLDYMHARYYGSGWGRFASVDPVLDTEKAPAKPQTWNRYAYVSNGPVTNLDPDGKETRVFFVGATNIVRDSSGGFGHTAIWVSSNGHSNGLSFGGQFDFQRDSAYQTFVKSYTDEGRTLDVLVLKTTPEQDQKMLEHINSTKPNLGTWSLFSNNCTTTTDETLKAGGVLPATQTVVWRGGVTEVHTPTSVRPEELKDTLLSRDNLVKDHYEATPTGDEKKPLEQQ